VALTNVIRSTVHNLAGHALGVASPVVRRVTARIRRTPTDDPAATTRPEVFTPTAAPSPATVARNVSGPRPVAKTPRPKPASVPGAKLPVRRTQPGD
jgi:hypothetical protein